MISCTANQVQRPDCGQFNPQRGPFIDPFSLWTLSSANNTIGGKLFLRGDRVRIVIWILPRSCWRTDCWCDVYENWLANVVSIHSFDSLWAYSRASYWIGQHGEMASYKKCYSNIRGRGILKFKTMTPRRPMTERSAMIYTSTGFLEVFLCLG